jgi:LTXXQ motif family protein
MFPFSRFRIGRALPLFALAGFGLTMMACHKHHSHRFCHSCEDSDGLAQKAAKRFSRHLDLNASQQREVQALFQSTFEDACKLKPQHDSIKSAFLQDLKSDMSQPENLIARLDQGRAAMDTMKQLLLESYSRLHGILTPEQRKKLAEMIEKRS